MTRAAPRCSERPVCEWRAALAALRDALHNYTKALAAMAEVEDLTNHERD